MFEYGMQPGGLRRKRNLGSLSQDHRGRLLDSRPEYYSKMVFIRKRTILAHLHDFEVDLYGQCR